MKLSLECIEYNLQLLEEVKSEFPILEDFSKGNIRRETIQSIGLDSFINLIDFIKVTESRGMKLVYSNKITYKQLKDKIVENTFEPAAKSIFSKKSRKKFDSMWTDSKSFRKYNNPRNLSYCTGLQFAEPIIINYLVQNQIEIDGLHMIKKDFYSQKISKPRSFSRELRVTQDFIKLLLNYAQESNLDVRKCNIKSLTTELQFKLKELSFIEPGLTVKCISEYGGFTKDSIYIVQESRVTHQGFLEIKLTNDKGITTFYPYSEFEEISRQRDDILSRLGI